MHWIRNNRLKTVIVVVLGVVIGTGTFGVTRAVGVFDAITSEDFAPEAAALALSNRTAEQVDEGLESLLESERARLEQEHADQLAEAELDAEIEAAIRVAMADHEEAFSLPEATSPPLPDEMFTSVLLIGADASGYLADVIIDVLLPSDGSRPLMVSLPRDLYLPNRCTGGYTKVNANLGGCKGLASGTELLALAVEDFTGIAVDHFARVNFAGFAAVVDRLGGVRVCVGDDPVRDVKSGLSLDAGCHRVGGETALAWVRSRSPEYLVDGEWRSRGGSDFERQEKQQDVLFQLASVLSSYSSVGSLAGALDNLASAVRMDTGLSITEAASIAFRYRGLDPSDVIRLRVPVRDHRTAGGAAVLLPVERFNDVLADAYPAAAA